MKNKQSGFTLVEMMITVAIIGIISAIAYPSYMNSVRQSNRSEAKAELTDIAQRLQRCYTAYARYNHASCAIATQLSNGGFVTSTGRGFYQVTAALTNTTYTLTARPVLPPQTGDTANGCDSMTLNNQGVRLPVVCW